MSFGWNEEHFKMSHKLLKLRLPRLAVLLNTWNWIAFPIAGICSWLEWRGYPRTGLYQIIVYIIGHAFKGGREKKKKKKAHGWMHNSCVLCLKLENESSNISTQYDFLTAFHVLLILASSSTLSTIPPFPKVWWGSLLGKITGTGVMFPWGRVQWVHFHSLKQLLPSAEGKCCTEEQRAN